MKNRKRRMKRKVAMVLIMRALLAASALAVEPNPKDPAFVDAMHQIRMKQQDEEGNTVRLIQQPVGLLESACSPIQQARQRLNDLASKEGKKAGSVNVEAGHGEVNVEENSGTVNNNINVQVVNPNEKNCL